MKKKFKNKKGSSLMLILIVMSVLMIVGTAIISLAMSSYKFRMVEQNKKTSLYASEAGIDEAYGIIGDFVQSGIEQGNKAVEQYNKNFDNYIEFKRKNKDISYISEDGIINNDAVNADRERIFQEGYKTNSDNSYDENGSIVIEKGYKQFIQDGFIGIQTDLINHVYTKVDSSDTIEIKAATYNGKNSFVGNYPQPIEPIALSITSSYTHNAIPKKIKVIYEINMAKYNVQYNLPTQIVKIPKNVIWSKALVVNGDMKINGGNVIVGSSGANSDIYVKGKDVGINLASNNSKLNVFGNIVTNKDVNLSYNNDNGVKDDNLNVKGNIYCENVTIDSNSPGAKIITSPSDSLPARDGSVYTMDDLEMNADRSTVNIAGAYYGVSDGSQSEMNNPDKSSSIIINAEDIGNENGGSSLKIEKQVYIAGTSYINLDNDVKYQTGESMSIKGNYKAYTEPLSNPSVDDKDVRDLNQDNIIFDSVKPLIFANRIKQVASENLTNLPIEAVTDTNRNITVYLTDTGLSDPVYSLADSFHIVYDNIESGSAGIGNNVNILTNKGVGDTVTVKLFKKELNTQTYKVEETLIGDPIDIKLVLDTTLNVFERSNYFNEYYKEFKENSDLNLGNGISINKSIINTSVENINIGAIFTPDKPEKISVSNWNEALDRKIKAKRIQLKNQLFYMGNAKYYENLSDTTDIDNIGDSTDVSDSNYTKIDQRTEPLVSVESNVRFDNMNSYNKNLLSQVIDDKITVLDNDANKTYLLKGKDTTDLEITSITDKEKEKGLVVVPIDLSSPDLYKGIILTEGNVIIAGELNFAGTIICNGDLTFEGSGDKHISYDKTYLENYAMQNFEMFLNTFKNYTPQEDVNYLFARVYNNTTIANNLDNKFKLIKRKTWELIR